MPTPDNNREAPEGRDLNSAGGERHSSIPGDLPDNPRDAAKLEGEETIINLPDVADIPGQEHVHVPRMESFADTTIASDDEEGTRVFDDADNEDLRSGTAADVGRDENMALRDSDYTPTRDENNLRRAALDNTDFEGEYLNEGSFGSGRGTPDPDFAEGGDDTARTATSQDELNTDDNTVQGTP